jgi:putative ABC transport system permease protein
MLTNYIKIAWKVLLRHPFYTFITLFGISLTLTVLMVLTAFIDHLVGSHYPETNRYRSLYIERIKLEDSTRSSTMSSPMSYKFLADFAKTLKTPERVSVFSTSHGSNAYAGSRKIKLDTKFTDADFWRVMEFDFIEGKPYNEQNINNGEFVAVITDRIKEEYFDNPDEPAVGKSIELENVTYRVIGVVRGVPLTRLFTAADVYFPYTVPKSNYQNTGHTGNYQAILLSKGKKEMEEMRNEFQGRISQLPLPGVEGWFKYAVLTVPSEPYVENFLGMLFSRRDTVAIFFGVVSFLMLMIMGLPTINLINLNVSRIMERSSEIGIRKAFGAPIRTLLWQFIIENIFITFIGGSVALAFTLTIIYLINSSGWIAHADLTINLSVFAVSVFLCLLFGLLSGVLPALRMSKLSIIEALKS